MRHESGADNLAAITCKLMQNYTENKLSKLTSFFAKR